MATPGQSAEASAEVGQVPNNLSILVPSFDPAVDNVEIWTNKVELLLSAWPANKIQELATRLVLGCKGTAFQKLQLHRKEILINDPQGIQRLVELVGGKWGAIPLEKKFELVEKALYRSQQKMDESSDSYLSRCDVVWTELIGKKIDMAEIQAYILLRGSRLGSEDKKRVIVDSGAEKGGALEVSKVEAAVRMIGSGFFQDMVGFKKEKGLKTYDHTAFTLEEQSENMDTENETFWMQDDVLDDSTLESLAAEDDDDAALVLQFEDAVAETVQNDAELSAFYSSYQEARKRLSEKVRFRGFWAVKRGDKGSGKKGKVKGKGKSSLASRIANSYCRICMKKGHWKNECPSRSTASSTAPSTAPTSFVTTAEIPEELINLSTTEEKSGFQSDEVCLTMMDDKVVIGDKWGFSKFKRGLSRSKLGSKNVPTHASIRESIATLRQLKLRRSEPTVSMTDSEHLSLFASSGSIGVVDLGASQTVIGSKQVPDLLRQIPEWVRSRVRRQSCHLVFRFGNHQTLVSRHALMLPLGNQFFRIAVVEGNTPFLISSSFLKGIQAVIDTEQETMWSKSLNRHLKVSRNHKNLFLMDLNELWPSEIPELCTVSAKMAGPDPCLASESKIASSQLPQPSEESTTKHVDVEKVHQVDQVEQSSMTVPMHPKSGTCRQFSVDHVDHRSCTGTNKTEPAPVDLISYESHGVSVSATGSVSSQDRREPVTGSCSRPEETQPAGTGERSDRVWESKAGNPISGSLQRSQVDGLVCEPIRKEPQSGTPKVCDVRGEEARSGDQERGVQEQDSDQTEGQRIREVMGSHQGGIGGGKCRGMGANTSQDVRCDHRDGHSSRSSESHVSGESEPQSSHVQPRGQHGRDPHASQKSERVRQPVEIFHGEDVADWDFNFMVPPGTNCPSFKSQVSRLVKQFEMELKQVPIPRMQQSRIDLLEVMCHDHSELTRQMQIVGGKALRFSMTQGDLSTPTGRHKLFSMLVNHRPKHVWYSPECFPWCLWNQYNESRSLELWEQIYLKRQASLWQISLGIVLYRHQVYHRSHFHHEQPAGSKMKSVAGMEEITDHTYCSRFDMCQVGNLRDPETGEAIRKRLEVHTTSENLHRNLHKRLCPGLHEHRHIAGQTMVQGHRMPLSKFTEQYPPKFARQVTKIMFHSHDTPVLGTETADDEEHPTKKRRLSQKMNLEAIAQKFSSINWQTVMSLADQLAPRVGTLIIDNGPLIQQVQAMCNNQTVKHVVLCRGTDRHVGPNKSMFPGEAPLRRRVCIRRKIEDVQVDTDWEPWEKLTYKGLRRKAIPARVSLTIFAQAKMLPEDSLPSSADAAIPTMPERDHVPPLHAEPSAKRVRFANMPDTEMPMSSNSSSSTPPSNSSLRTINDNPYNLHINNHSNKEFPEADRNVIDLASQKHGPKFLKLDASAQAWLIKIHRNLGHPGSQKLMEFCRQLQCPEEFLQAIPDLNCSTCKETQQPKVARPAAIHEPMDFGEVISMDGVTWTNSKGDQFHFYHFIDQATSYHTAVGSVSRSATSAIQALLQGWFQWAGAPSMIVFDAATEFNSEEFEAFLQRFNVKSKTCAAEAHWQNSRVERHGGVLQMMLTKMDHEENISSYSQLATALMQATMTKNKWSRYRGYPPEMLVFGKSTKSPASVISDDESTAHEFALRPTAEGLRFRAELECRERARRAFAAVDNDQTLRRALHGRSRPSRGQYAAGEWVMLWKQRGEASGQWEGPMNVIIQEGNKVVWVTRGTKLYRAAPEHIRPLSAVEEWNHNQQCPNDSGNNSQQGSQSIIPPHGVTQLHNLNNQGNLQDNSMPSNNATRPATHIHDEPSDVQSDPEPEATPGNLTPEGEKAMSEESTGQLPQVEADRMPPLSAETIAAPIQTPIPEDDDDSLMVESCNWFEDFNECFHLSEDQVWRMEVDVNNADIDKWRQETNPHAMAFLVSAAKKQRSEVKMSQLNETERQLFHQAKMKEIDSWLATETVAKVLRHQIPEENILRCRWILTWKPVDSPGPKDSKHVPKARLVVLGYEDPLVHEIPRDSPTMSKLSRMLIVQWAASMGWDIESFDIKTAFLRGQEQSERVLGVEPTAELREKLKLKPNEVLRLLKGAYGRVDAPYLWFMELKKGLENLGFIPSPFDPCVFVLPNAKSGTPEGLVGIHVDDGLCCGSEVFQEKLRQLSEKFPFGSHKRRNFTFTGLKIDQQPDQSIHIHQTQYIKDIHHITVSRERRSKPEDPVTDAERQELRALIGSLQYAAVNSRPDLCSRLGWLQSRINRAQVSTLLEANRTLHEAKLHAEVTIKVQPIPIAKLRFVAFSDASFSSQKEPDSHQGMMIMSCHENIGSNRTSPVNPLVWHSKKIQKVAVSTLSAEAMSLAGTVDMLSWVRLYWGWIMNVNLPWKKADQTLLQLPPAFAAIPPIDPEAEVPPCPDNTFELLKQLPQSNKAIITTDCKSLCDLISRTAPPSCGEFRTLLQAKLIKEHLSNGIQIRWVPSAAQVADSLTKVMDNTMLRECLHLGKYCLHDESEILKARSDSRSRLQWLRQSAASYGER